MAHTLLISAPQLQQLMHDRQRLMVFDCSFDLCSPAQGKTAYLQEHIPGAVYADLDAHLSSKPGSGAPAPCSGGRHPLPQREHVAAWLSSVGLANDMQAVVYDRNGTHYCGRLWWMLKWLGHDAVAVLDGGLQAWKAAGGPTLQGQEAGHFQSNFQIGAPLRRLVSAQQVLQQLGQAGQTVIDARASARYRGEVEPLDPVAGHIPGALNRPFGLNLQESGHFKPAAQLRAEFDALLAGRDPASVVHQCGSGVTAIPNLLAMEIAGYPPCTLFAGSWSEWCSDPSRPVEKS